MACAHTNQIKQDVKPKTQGCESCERTGSKWVQLRMCLTCGHVGCCDSTPGQHATNHFKQTGHAIMRSHLAPRDFAWCYTDEDMLDLDTVNRAHRGG